MDWAAGATADRSFGLRGRDTASPAQQTQGAVGVVEPHGMKLA